MNVPLAMPLPTIILVMQDDEMLSPNPGTAPEPEALEVLDVVDLDDDRATARPEPDAPTGRARGTRARAVTTTALLAGGAAVVGFFAPQAAASILHHDDASTTNTSNTTNTDGSSPSATPFGGDDGAFRHDLGGGPPGASNGSSNGAPNGAPSGGLTQSGGS
jgi:hypothetical protein